MLFKKKPQGYEIDKIEVAQSIANNLKALVTLAGLRGIIPNPITTTRIYKWANALGDQTTIIYTVPMGKVLFITTASLASRESAAAVSACNISVRNDSDVDQYTLLAHFYDIAGHQVNGLNFIPALELAANWDVYIVSGHANIDARGIIHGWLEDV